MNRFAKQAISVAAIILVSMANAHAVECLDPSWTRAITEAMGRAPGAGECNVKLYAKAESHQEKVTAVRDALGKLYQDLGRKDVATQKLALTALGH